MWVKCEDKKTKAVQWCDFWELDLDSVGNVLGVYIVWGDSVVPYVIYVGKGEIAERIEKHRRKKDFIRCKDDGEKMFVTWQEFPDKELRGREKYLANLLQPEIGERHPEKVRSIKTDPPSPLRKLRRLNFGERK